MDNELNGGLYQTFEAYCKGTWNFNSSRARQFISATKISDNLKSVTTVTPISERQTRPLTRLEPAQQKEAWDKAVERYERKQMKARKNKVWSKINRGGKRIALRRPYQDELLKELREAGNVQ